ncbi:MAG TPA: pitrilysin family protein [Candidatus Limnocylindrales bacterium]|nr:pitrilysin family protein [Candidatus Limnocylindrales bacterium]
MSVFTRGPFLPWNVPSFPELIKRGAALSLMAAFLVTVTQASFGQDLASFEKRVTKRVLENGLTVLIVERPEAPVFSFFTHVDVGSDREYPGISGLAHMFEHMAFKGTDKIGTKNYATEKEALAKVEQTYQEYDRERRKETGSDTNKVAALEKTWKDAIAEAQQYVVENEFGQVIEQKGGTGLNAFTDNEETGYHYSLPSNDVELWAYLESERFLHPVMREFYKERDVVHEERRLSESQPMGRLFEQFMGAAFIAHPYGKPVVGWPSDLESFSATDAQNFYKKYYVPANMVVALVGDVKAAEVMPIVEKYFSRLPKQPKPEPLRTVEPPQKAERIVILHETSQPVFIEGYHKPGARDKDDAVYDALQDLMSNGRTSRLYRALVRDKKIAAVSAGFNGFPGAKYPNLFVFYAISTPGHTPEEIREAIHQEIERVKTQDITEEELQMIKTRAKADLVRQLADNEGLALQFGTYESLFGDWRQLFRHVDDIEKVSKADIRRVAQTIFVDSNRTVGIIESSKLAQAGNSEEKE